MLFESPKYLWALPIVLLPLLLHFLSSFWIKSRALTAPVFIFQRRLALWRRLRLRRAWTAVTRMAILALVVLLFAEPILEDKASRGPKHPGSESLILVLDDSIRSAVRWQGREAWLAVKERAIEIIEKTGARQIAVGGLCGHGNFLDFLSPQEAQSIIKGLPRANVYCPTADFHPEGSMDAMKVYITPWLASGEKLLPGFSLESLGLGPISDSGIKGAKCQGLGECSVLLSFGDRQDLVLSARCMGDHFIKKQWNLKRPAQEPAMFNLALEFDCPMGRMELMIPSDFFPLNDSLPVVLEEPRPAVILLVDGQAGSGLQQRSTFFLESGLRAIRDQGNNFLIRTVNQDFLNTRDIKEADIVILADPRPLRRHILDVLSAFVEQGKSLLFTGGPALVSWENILPFSEGHFLREQVRDEKTFVSLFQVPRDLAPAISSRMIPSGFDGSTFQVDLSYSDGAPAAVSRSWGRGRVAFWMFPVDLSWGEYPLSIFFPVFLKNQLEHSLLAHSESRLGQCTVGRPCLPDRDVDLVESPLGKAGPGVLRDLSDANPYLTPGIYSSVFEGRVSPLLSLNLSNIDIEMALARPVSASIQSLEFLPPRATTWPEEQSLRTVFLLLLVLAVTLETVVFRHTT